MALLLRPLGIGDEATCLAAHAECRPFPFLLLWRPDAPWTDYVRLLDGLRDGSCVPEGLVRSDLLLAEVDDAVVGRVSLRFELNDRLAAEGGHVGYCVRPRFRRRGHATAMLRQALPSLRAGGVRSVLVVCDDDNAGSAKVIERCGGQLESVVQLADETPPFRRYWIG